MFFYNIKSFFEDVADLGRDIKQLNEDLKESLTDGFVEIVIKDNENYKTSSEIRCEADKIIYEQKEKYEKKCNKLNEIIKKVDKHINSSYEKKYDLYKNIKGIEKQQRSINQISGQNYTVPEYIKPFPYNELNRLLSPKTYNIISGESFAPMMTNLGDGFLEQRERVNNSKNYLSQAKDFEVTVSNKVAEMNRMNVMLDAVEESLNDEDTILKSLEDRFNSGLISNSESEKIAEKLKDLMYNKIVDENCKRNQNYIRILNELDILCKEV